MGLTGGIESFILTRVPSKLGLNSVLHHCSEEGDDPGQMDRTVERVQRTMGLSPLELPPEHAKRFKVYGLPVDLFCCP